MKDCWRTRRSSASSYRNCSCAGRGSGARVGWRCCCGASAVLPELTADDLKDLGVSLVGHRRKLLAAIAALSSDIGPKPDTPVAASAAERRQLTVMFCDLVGSSELASGSLPV